MISTTFLSHDYLSFLFGIPGRKTLSGQIHERGRLVNICKSSVALVAFAHSLGLVGLVRSTMKLHISLLDFCPVLIVHFREPSDIFPEKECVRFRELLAKLEALAEGCRVGDIAHGAA